MSGGVTFQCRPESYTTHPPPAKNNETSETEVDLDQSHQRRTFAVVPRRGNPFAFRKCYLKTMRLAQNADNHLTFHKTQYQEHASEISTGLIALEP